MALAEAAHDMYIKYLEDNILDQTELQHLLTNQHQLLYLSVGSVRQEFQNQGLYKWFRPFSYEPYSTTLSLSTYLWNQLFISTNICTQEKCL